ncbi:MAG: efflux RND transporter permease subunit, partial [Sandaracinaceae bacterium]
MSGTEREQPAPDPQTLDVRVAGVDCDNDASRLKASVEGLPGVLAVEVWTSSARLRASFDPATADVAVQLYGDDLETLDRVGDDLVRVLSSVDGAGDVMAEQVAGLPFLNVTVDRAALARYGVNARDVSDAVATAAGHPVGQVFEGQRRFTLQVRLPEAARNDAEAIGRIPITLPQGGVVPLGELARIENSDGPATISRQNVRRRMTIQVYVRGRDVASFVSEAQERIRGEVEMPSGYFVEWGGQFRNLQEATGRLAIAVPAVLLLIFLLLFMTYGSARPALLVYL